MDLIDYYHQYDESQNELYRQRVEASKHGDTVDQIRGYAREGAGHVGHSFAALGEWAYDGVADGASNLWNDLF